MLAYHWELMDEMSPEMRSAYLKFTSMANEGGNHSEKIPGINGSWNGMCTPLGTGSENSRADGSRKVWCHKRGDIYGTCNGNESWRSSSISRGMYCIGRIFEDFIKRKDYEKSFRTQ